MARGTAIDADDWARLLGLVDVPLFDRFRGKVPPGIHRMMQDGDAASFACHVSPSKWLVEDVEPLGWAYSANVRHSVIFDPESAVATVRRWDDQTFKHEQPVRSDADVFRLFRVITDKSSPLSVPTVIRRTLNSFTTLRAAIEERHGTRLDAVLAFNAAILLAETWRGPLDQIPAVELGTIVERLKNDHRPGFDGSPPTTKRCWPEMTFFPSPWRT
jgi:hypothetical protein